MSVAVSKPVFHVADRAGEVWVNAEAKIGSELAKLPKAKGRAGPGRGKAGAKAGPAFDDAPTLAELGVNKKRATRAQKLAALPTAECKRHIKFVAWWAGAIRSQGEVRKKENRELGFLSVAEAERATGMKQQRVSDLGTKLKKPGSIREHRHERPACARGQRAPCAQARSPGVRQRPRRTRTSGLRKAAHGPSIREHRMNRHERRASAYRERSGLQRFRRNASTLVTYLVESDASLAGHAVLSRAVQHWRDNVRQRQPCCISCRTNFADDAEPGAFLLAHGAFAPTTASVSALCTRCWTELSPEQIEASCARLLRQFAPGGRFL
jgi:hypothetical protein